MFSVKDLLMFSVAGSHTVVFFSFQMILWTGFCVATAPPRLYTVAVIYFVLGFVLFFPVFIGFCLKAPLPMSTSPGFLWSHSSSPLCSGMASGINQSIILCFSFFFALSLSEMGGRGGWGSHHSLQFCLMFFIKFFFFFFGVGVGVDCVF